MGNSLASGFIECLMSRQLFGGGRWESNELDLSIGVGNSPVAAEGGVAVANLIRFPGAALNRFAFLPKAEGKLLWQFAQSEVLRSPFSVPSGGASRA